MKIQLLLVLAIACIVPMALATPPSGTFSIPNGSVELTAAPMWTSGAYINAAAMQIVDTSGKQFVRMASYPRVDYASDFEGFVQMETKRSSVIQPEGTVSAPKQIDINGQKAFQLELHWTDPNHYRWAGTVIALYTEHYFVEFQAFTSESKFNDFLPQLPAILASIQEGSTQSYSPSTQPITGVASSADKEKVFCASDDSIEITVGSNWKDYVVNGPNTTLHIADQMEQQFIQAGAIARADYASNLRGFAEAEAERFSQCFPNASVSQPSTVEINGTKAIQWQMHWVGDDNIR